MTDQQKAEFIRLRIDEGCSLKTIAAKMNTDALTVVSWESELEPELYAHRRLYIDQQLHERQVDAAHRVDYLVDTYERMAAELKKRDFSGLPTDKLYFMLNDLFDVIKKAL
ncbi:MAG TPA: hypothetical protein ENJ10_11005 [Caldithrix abyssi]|uniref:Uncharacterized protein n=1 Tax=Caldithrix abyssi TaxID=187145 RepID=A0A7V1PVP9_CALAY|nr:hypothetical protein [Caldithrix abyssi]